MAYTNNFSLYLNPMNIRFTQDSIRPYFKGGQSLLEVVGDFLSGRTCIGYKPLLRVLFRRGHFWTLNNRSLWVYQQLQKHGLCRKIKVKQVFTSEISDRAWLHHFTTKTEGKTISVRRKYHENSHSPHTANEEETQSSGSPETNFSQPQWDFLHALHYPNRKDPSQRRGYVSSGRRVELVRNGALARIRRKVEKRKSMEVVPSQNVHMHFPTTVAGWVDQDQKDKNATHEDVMEIRRVFFSSDTEAISKFLAEGNVSSLNHGSENKTETEQQNLKLGTTLTDRNSSSCTLKLSASVSNAKTRSDRKRKSSSIGRKCYRDKRPRLSVDHLRLKESTLVRSKVNVVNETSTHDHHSLQKSSFSDEQTIPNSVVDCSDLLIDVQNMYFPRLVPAALSGVSRDFLTTITDWRLQGPEMMDVSIGGNLRLKVGHNNGVFCVAFRWEFDKIFTLYFDAAIAAELLHMAKGFAGHWQEINENSNSIKNFVDMCLNKTEPQPLCIKALCQGILGRLLLQSYTAKTRATAAEPQCSPTLKLKFY